MLLSPTLTQVLFRLLCRCFAGFLPRRRRGERLAQAHASTRLHSASFSLCRCYPADFECPRSSQTVEFINILIVVRKCPLITANCVNVSTNPNDDFPKRVVGPGPVRLPVSLKMTGWELYRCHSYGNHLPI